MFSLFLEMADQVEMYPKDYEKWLKTLTPDELEILNERNNVIVIK